MPTLRVASIALEYVQRADATVNSIGMKKMEGEKERAKSGSPAPPVGE